MPIPKLSALQYLYLTLLLREPLTGKELRLALARAGLWHSGPTFYQTMARLAAKGYLVIHRGQPSPEQISIPEFSYQITKTGREEVKRTKAFYADPTTTRQPKGK